MATATWNGAVIAESTEYEVVEGNVYFPAGSVNRNYLRDSARSTHCSWKGDASYYDVVVDDAVNEDAAWYYAAPLDAAANIKNYVAFWRGVEVER